MKLIGISGGSGSGKTTLARLLNAHWGESNSNLIFQDSYYIDRSSKFTGDGSLNFDHPEAIDWKLMVKHLSLLKKGLPIEVPIYNFETHSRESHRTLVEPKEYVLVDGILIFHSKPLRELFDLKIFVDCPESLRFERRLKRDVEERGRTAEGVRAQYASTVLPMHDEFIEPTKTFADEILSGAGDLPPQLNHLLTLL